MPGDKRVSKEQELFEEALARTAADRLLYLMQKMIITESDGCMDTSQSIPYEKDHL